MTQGFPSAAGSQKILMTSSLRRALTLALCYSVVAASNIVSTEYLTPEQALTALERRQNSCSSQNPVSCSAVDSNLPSNACCPQGTSCISVDSSSTAVCCPAGESCLTIQVISCNVNLQNPSRNVAGPVFTTRTNDSLPTCGNACCPFGYTCEQRTDNSNYCRLDTSKAIIAQPSANTTNPSTTATPTTTSTSTQSVSGETSTPTSSAPSNPPNSSAQASSGIDSTAPPPEKANNPFPPAVFIAGFLPGIVIGALAVLAWVILTGRHKKQQPVDSRSSSPYKPDMVVAYDSAPNNAGADMARKRKTFGITTKQLFNARKSEIGTPGLPFDNADGWKTLTPPQQPNIPMPGPRIPAGPGARLGSDASSKSSGTMNSAIERPPPGPRYGPTGPATGLPVTPTRNGPNGNAGGEVIRIYSPPMIDRPSAAVAPLRGMSSQRRSRESEMGSFSTYGMGEKRVDQPRMPFSPYEPTQDEVLSPVRYDASGPQFRPRDYSQPRPERPETTFTDMLRQINFPDPMQDGKAPAMPSIPNKYKG